MVVKEVGDEEEEERARLQEAAAEAAEESEEDSEVVGDEESEGDRTRIGRGLKLRGGGTQEYNNDIEFTRFMWLI